MARLSHRFLAPDINYFVYFKIFDQNIKLMRFEIRKIETLKYWNSEFEIQSPADLK